MVVSCLRYVPIARGRHAATLVGIKIYFFDSKEDLKETKFFSTLFFLQGFLLRKQAINIYISHIFIVITSNGKNKFWNILFKKFLKILLWKLWKLWKNVFKLSKLCLKSYIDTELKLENLMYCKILQSQEKNSNYILYNW